MYVLPANILTYNLHAKSDRENIHTEISAPDS